MVTRHMTDDEIQAYLETGTSAMDQVFDAHLIECRTCRERVESYRSLFQVLGEEPGYEFAPNFADTVVIRIAAEQAAEARRRWQGLLWTLAGIAIAFGAMAIFMDLSVVWASLSRVFGPSIQEGTRSFHEAREAVSALDGLQEAVTSDGGGTVIVIVFCLVILAVVAGADHLLFRSRQAKFCL